MVFPDFKSIVTIPNLIFMHELVYIHWKKYRYEHRNSPFSATGFWNTGALVATEVANYMYGDPRSGFKSPDPD